MKFTPFPVLETDRLLLRKPKVTDASQILFLRSDPIVNKYISRKPSKDLDEAKEFVRKILEGIANNKHVYWSISSKDHGDEMVGSISLWHFSEDLETAEIGYDLHPQWHSKGMMTEAMQAVLAFGFKYFSTIEAYTHFENEASIRLLKKHGFVKLEERRDPNVPHNRIFALAKSD